MPVRRAEVEVHTEREERAVVLFLAPGSAPEDLFEQDAPFFPAEHDGVVKLFARASVMSIVADEGPPEALSELGIPFDTRTVTVHLRSGKALTGTIRSIGRTRTLDLLNQPAKSFALSVEGKVHHVAKAHVEHIVELR